MRTQENKEKYKEYDHKYYIKNRRPKTKIGQAELKITDLEAKLAEMTKKYELASCPTGGLVDRVRNLEQQLEEKDKEIHSLIVDYEKRISQEQELMSNLEKELAELKEKDNYHLRYELAGADETITNLKKQLEEKDKEIEKLNAIKNNAIECADLFKVALSVRQKDLAIQELEKVKAKVRDVSGVLALCEVEVQINNQIKELKGEKDVKD